MIPSWMTVAALVLVATGFQAGPGVGSVPAASTAAAQGAPDAASSAPRARLAVFDADLRLRTFAYPHRVVPADAHWTVWFSARAGVQGAASRVTWRGAVQVDVSSETAVTGSLVDLADREARRPTASLRDLAVRVSPAPGLGIEGGRLRPTWAHTDAFSPADAFLPRDLTDPFADERLPVWGARVDFAYRRLRAEWFQGLTTTPWRLPIMRGRLSPGWYADIFLDDAQEPAPRRGFQMGRIAVHGAGWDASAWVRTGVRPAPVLTLDRTRDAELPVGTLVPMRRSFTTERAAGIGATRVTGTWVLHGELAYLESPHPDVGRALLWSVGADRAARQGVFTVTLAGNGRDTPIDPLGLPDRAFLPYFVATSTQQEEWGTWNVRWLATLRRIGGILTIDLTRTLTSRTSVVGGVDLPHGSRTSSPGAISRARRAHAGLRWTW